ncbi:MAG: excinuclease ABC subunit UvrC [Dehalococcoidales bacterium]|nr:excinuclease ABC subunit UvrC [Dehalococcoidales bacterium]
MTSSLIVEQLKHLPFSPGVYLMRDTGGNILYVGKAASLRHRVRSYFRSVEKLSPKLQRMVAQVSDIDFFITNSEEEALILECNLIKRYHPHYNVRLKDGKTYPYLKINLNEDWPRVYITRQLEENGARYFGPFASPRSIRQTLKVLKGIFPFRSCSRAITGSDSRPCLEYHIHHCLGPCIGAVSRQEYAKVIKQIALFLEGKQETVARDLKSKMEKAAETLDFERAALIRNQLQAIDRVIKDQKIATVVKGEQDVVAFATDRDQAYVQVYFIRSGKLIGRESFILQGITAEEPKQIMSSFIKQFYDSATYIPPLLLLQYPVDDEAVIERWLQKKRGASIHIEVPSRGRKKQLVNIVAENAKEGMQQNKMKQRPPDSSLAVALAEIKRELDLPSLPSRIECYDISNIQGKLAVGSMVVFENGKPKPSDYRRFRIKTVSGSDDYAMLQEVLRRRFKRIRPNGNKDSTANAWTILPALVLIDGGKGQLNASLSAMQEVGADLIPVASLAKENEELFIPGRKEAITLPRSSLALQLLQHLRDEAHRFALGYHLKIRRKETLTSVLDAIPGIGPKRKRALLKRFGSVHAIREASTEELATTRGMSQGLAQKMKEYL